MKPALHRSWSADLDPTTLYTLLTLRIEVFVVEQNCPYRELDGTDLQHDTRHFWLSRGDEVLATVRLAERHDGEVRPGAHEFRIGRLCTARDARGHGHARRLLQAALADVGSAPCRLNAQSQLAAMYTAHGFAPDGAEFLEDGIAHIPMLRIGR